MSASKVINRKNAPKFNALGQKYGTKAERKNRDNHKNRRRKLQLEAIYLLLNH